MQDGQTWDGWDGGRFWRADRTKGSGGRVEESAREGRLGAGKEYMRAAKGVGIEVCGRRSNNPRSQAERTDADDEAVQQTETAEAAQSEQTVDSKKAGTRGGRMVLVERTWGAVVTDVLRAPGSSVARCRARAQAARC